ncbi:unnamed protein product [Schistosoma curassoni]|uniref:Uncharacterized protein n=1 Tax=Schistosoma curassoni TaxID=6186 RepID=A0A183L4T2_9TREM|nr:unnamed protein product [Schistosoma curassoni]
MNDWFEAAVPSALQSRSQVAKTTTNLTSFSGPLKSEILSRCGQLVSDSARDHRVDDQIPPSSLNNFPIPTTNLSHQFLPSCATNANDFSSRNVILSFLKSSSKLHVEAFNVRTQCQIKKQDSLARIVESRATDVYRISETRMQDPSTVIHLTSSCKYKKPIRFTLRVFGDPSATSHRLVGVGVRKQNRLS